MFPKDPQRVLITFVGTNKYSETVYQWSGIGEHRSAYIAVALAKLWKATDADLKMKDVLGQVSGGS